MKFPIQIRTLTRALETFFAIWEPNIRRSVDLTKDVWNCAVLDILLAASVIGVLYDVKMLGYGGGESSCVRVVVTEAARSFFTCTIRVGIHLASEHLEGLAMEVTGAHIVAE